MFSPFTLIHGSLMRWQVRCPDGHVRHYPYLNREDAAFDCSVFDRCCQRYDTLNALERELPPCRGKPHVVVPDHLLPMRDPAKS